MRMLGGGGIIKKDQSLTSGECAYIVESPILIRTKKKKGGGVRNTVRQVIENTKKNSKKIPGVVNH